MEPPWNLIIGLPQGAKVIEDIKIFDWPKVFRANNKFP